MSGFGKGDTLKACREMYEVPMFAAFNLIKVLFTEHG